MRKINLKLVLGCLKDEALANLKKCTPFTRESFIAQERYDALTIALYLAENTNFPEVK